LTTRAVNKKDKYDFSLELYVFKEDQYIIAYCPSLDITACGNTEKEAISEFYEIFKMHIEYCIEKGTLIEDLKQHGWSIRKTQPSFPIVPKTQRLIKTNPTLRNILYGDKEFKRINKEVKIPC
jgi:predicted RNase H-like HicB family nuclease